MVKGFISGEDFAGLDEAWQGEYVQQQDGRYQLTVTADDGWEFSNTQGLKSALESERGNATRRAQELKTFEGLDVTAAREALAKKEIYDAHDPTKSAEEAREIMRVQMTDRYDKEREVTEARSKKLTGQLEKLLKTDALTKAILTEKGNPTLLVPALQHAIQMRETEDGNLVVKVIGNDGNERVGDSSGSPMTIAQLVQEYKGIPEYQAAFTGIGKTGTGSGGEKVTGGGSIGGVLQIASSDQEAINANFIKISTGEAVVVAG